MTFKIGDKVKFVNETGGGVITKILSSSRVQVAIEDGFEIPYQITDLIKIDHSPQSTDYRQQATTNRQETSSENLPKPSDTIHLLKQGYLLSKELSGVYLGFVPTNQKLLVSGNLDIFLINHTEAEILFTIYTLDDEGNFSGKEYGIAESESKIYIDTIEREDINDWEQGFIQFIYYNYNNNNKILYPVNKEFKIKTQKLITADSYKTTPYFNEEKAFVININLYNEQPLLFEQDEENIDEPKEIVQKVIEKSKQEEAGIASFIKKHMVNEHTAEVDMHIWELAEDFSELKPNEIFRIQMNYFNKCLESALYNKLSRVVFIHGVGNGTLKKEIRDKLEEEFPQIKVFDAAIAQYGIGATEITIPYNWKM